MNNTIIDKQFILNVVNKTTTYVGKKMLRTEIEGLIHYIKEIDLKLMKNDNPDVIVDKIAKNFAKQLGVRIARNIDTHEVMKKQLGISDKVEVLYQDSCTGNGKEISNTTEGFVARDRDNDVYNMPQYSIANQPKNLYLLLDSKYRNLSTDNSVFKWTVLHSNNSSQGTVNALNDQVHNITNIQFEKFNIPYMASADNIYKKITLFIEEFSSMAVLTNTGRYHMMFDSDIQRNQIYLTPLINNEGKFRFHTPINILDSITIKFQSPFNNVVFSKDRYNIVITSTNTNQSILTFREPHEVADGELVHLEYFNTLNSILDFNIISNINREEGHIVTFINNTSLSIDVDLRTIALDNNNIVSCFIASRRLVIPIRMEYYI